MDANSTCIYKLIPAARIFCQVFYQDQVKTQNITSQDHGGIIFSQKLFDSIRLSSPFNVIIMIDCSAANFMIREVL